MKKVLLMLLAISALSLQSCFKTYTCMCPDGAGGTYFAGTNKALTKTEGKRGCRAIGQDEACTAE